MSGDAPTQIEADRPLSNEPSEGDACSHWTTLGRSFRRDNGLRRRCSQGGVLMDKLLRLVVAVHLRLTGSEDADKGATATEYALLVALIAIVIAVAVGFFGSQLSSFFDHIGST